jgi:hypothetical protein
MAKPRDVDLGHWNEMVGSFHDESDRGAAILAGSFAENALGHYLRFRMQDEKVANELFAPLGPLASFSQRIAIAYAFGLISKQRYDDFELIRKIRNHFAHHPMDAKFADTEVQQLAARLSMMETTTRDHKESRPGYRARIAYLLTCGMSCGSLLDAIEKAREKSAKKDV